MVDLNKYSLPSDFPLDLFKRGHSLEQMGINEIARKVRRIEWEKVFNHAEVNTVDEIISFLDQNVDEYSNVVYVIWDEGTLPIIQSTLEKVFKVIDDVTAVSFDTWIFSPSTGYVIEIFHDGEVRVGFK